MWEERRIPRPVGDRRAYTCALPHGMLEATVRPCRLVSAFAISALYQASPKVVLSWDFDLQATED